MGLASAATCRACPLRAQCTIRAPRPPSKHRLKFKHYFKLIIISIISTRAHTHACTHCITLPGPKGLSHPPTFPPQPEPGWRRRRRRPRAPDGTADAGPRVSSSERPRRDAPLRRNHASLISSVCVCLCARVYVCACVCHLTPGVIIMTLFIFSVALQRACVMHLRHTQRL